MRFTKMHGCGNDYVYINENVSEPEKLAVLLSDRRRSVGGDGIILICPSVVADAKMRIFNADGSEGKMCGNGIRCVAKYLYDNGIVLKSEMRIETLSGIKTCRILSSAGRVSTVSVEMGKIALEPSAIPVLLDSQQIVGVKQTFGGREYKITCVSLGNPHCVVFCGDIGEQSLSERSSEIQSGDIFPEGVNVEFVEIINSAYIKMRVWKRSGAESFSSGSGACAAVAAAVLNGYCKKGQDIAVELMGGTLAINYTSERIRMTGEAVKAFDGNIDFGSVLI